MVRLWNEKMEFVFIYIEEAHAVDEWPIAQLAEKDVPRHQTLSERIKIAREFSRDFKVHPKLVVLIDTMDNRFNAVSSVFVSAAALCECTVRNKMCASCQVQKCDHRHNTKAKSSFPRHWVILDAH